MGMTIVYLTALLAMLGMVGGVGLMLTDDRAFNDRLAAYAKGVAPPARRRSLRDLGPSLLQTLTRWGEQAGKGGIENESRLLLRAKLVQAGFYSDRAVEAFFGIRAAAAAGLAVVTIVLALALHLAGLLKVAAAVMIAVNIGLFVPNLLLASRIRQRTTAMYIGLPDAIDLMVVSLEAGATLSAAVQRVEAEFRDLHPVLTEQFGIMLMEMQAGASRSEALTRLALRSPGDEVRSLTTMIIQSEAVGASLGDTLRVFAEEMRQTRYLDAERKATELPVKLAFPLVFCIFPCLAGVIFIPIVIRFMRAMMH